MKYIMLQVSVGGNSIKIPVIFPDILVHKEMSMSVSHNIRMNHGWDPSVVSAGFINSEGVCHGKSESLKVESNPEDTRTIRSYDYTHGYC